MMYTNKKDIENWLDSMLVDDYTIQSDLTVDVSASVALSGKSLTTIPVQFGVVDGSFYCQGNQLKSLEGSPRQVALNFACNNNYLTNLLGGPSIVGGSYSCHTNALTSLQGCAQHLGGGFNCSHNKLTSFEFCPSTIGVDSLFNCQGNMIENLKLLPKTLQGKILFKQYLVIESIADIYNENGYIRMDFSDLHKAMDAIALNRDLQESLSFKSDNTAKTVKI